MTVKKLLSLVLPRTGHPLPRPQRQQGLACVAGGLISPSSRARGSLSRGQAEGEKRTRHHEREDLLAQVLGVERAWLFAHPETQVHPARAARFRRLATRLYRGEPLAQILGEQWFYGRPFRVTRDVLIPRPETELLIDLAISKSSTPNAQSSTLIDVGTGSGCIAITLAAELPHARVIATDISPAALRIARLNARRNGVADRIVFLRGNLLGPILQDADGILRLVPRTGLAQDKCTRTCVLANLPYLTTAEWRALPRSLRAYEPRTALDGGPDGLAPYRVLFGQLSDLTSHVSRLTALLEIDPRRRAALARLTHHVLPGWRATFHRDLAGRWRVFELQR